MLLDQPLYRGRSRVRLDLQFNSVGEPSIIDVTRCISIVPKKPGEVAVDVEEHLVCGWR